MAKTALLTSRMVDVEDPENETLAAATPELTVNPLLVVNFTPELMVIVLLPVKVIVFTVVEEVTVGALVVLPGITTSSVLPGVPVDGDQLLLELQVVLDDPVQV